MNARETPMTEDPVFTNAVRKAEGIYYTHCQRTGVNVPAAVEAGMIPLDRMQDGMMYAGHCRNADTAVWHAATKDFVIMRTEWGQTFPEHIPHPQNDEGFDVFVPVLEIGT